MLLSLRHDALVGRDHEQGDVHAGRTGQHVPHEPFMSGDVDHARLDGVAQRQGRESQVDGDAPPLLLLPAVGIDAGEGFHQGRLAVVDVTGGPDYEAAEGIGVRLAGEGGGTHARRSQKSRAESEPASARW